MTSAFAHVRSMFFAPGTNEELLTQALASNAHAVAADFEDMVPADQKDAARATVAAVFASSTSSCLKAVRINSPGNPEFEADLAAIAGLPLDAIVVPKATPEVITALPSDGPAILALIENGQGVRLAYDMATNPRVLAFMIGAGDLATDLGIDLRNDPRSVLYVNSKLVVDSAAAGIRAPFDIPSGATGAELEAEAKAAKSLGFGGKLCVRLDQIDIVNATWA